jgi:hypothetical protein
MRQSFSFLCGVQNNFLYIIWIVSLKEVKEKDCNIGQEEV